MFKLTTKNVTPWLSLGSTALFILVAISIYFTKRPDQKTPHTLFSGLQLPGRPGLSISCTYNGAFVEEEDKLITCSLRSNAPAGSNLDLRLDSSNGIASPFSTELSIAPGQTFVFITHFHFWSPGQQQLSLITDTTSAVATESLVVAPSTGDLWFHLFPYWFGFQGLLVVYSTVEKNVRAQRERQAQAQELIQAAAVKAEAAPEKAKFAWDLARVKLEDYFDRNLAQVNQIFWVAIVVMLIGFALIAWGVSIAFYNQKTTPAIVASISGIISEFIGVTFMVIYRSTMEQANQFMAVLERINTVGMAVQVLDSIPEQAVDLKNSTRAQIVSLLLKPRTIGGKTKAKHLRQRP